jgi:uncharacterized membrane protein HdeD (DUF308 family)
MALLFFLSWRSKCEEETRPPKAILARQRTSQATTQILTALKLSLRHCIKKPGIKDLPDAQLNRRRWTVIASGLLCGVLALVVVFTNRASFFSPMAVVVVAAIGSAAVLLQLRLRNRGQAGVMHPPVWLNLLGIIFAVVALFADRFGVGSQWAQFLALCAIATFAVSSAVILHAFRKNRATPK